MTANDVEQIRGQLQEYLDGPVSNYRNIAGLGMSLIDYIDAQQAYIDELERAYTSMAQSLSCVNEEVNDGR